MPGRSNRRWGSDVSGRRFKDTAPAFALTNMITLDEIKIIVKLTEGELGQNAMKAMVTLDFGGYFKVKGFRVQSSRFKNESGDLVWVTPPSYFSKGKYHPIFFSERKEWWKKMESKILEAYQFASMESAIGEIKEEHI